MTAKPDIQRTAHPAPSYRLKIGNRDITPTVDARLISLTLTECRGDEADQLDLVLSDHDGALELPSKGRELQLAIGWSVADLVDKGTFIVDEVEHSGAPDQITIRAHSADLGQALRARMERSFHDMTLGEILQQTATRHGLATRVGAALGSRRIEHVDQTNESDLNFITRLAKLHDAVATIKQGRLLFLPIVGTTTSDGDSLPVIDITRVDGDSHRYRSSERDVYTGVRSFWHDAGQAKRRSVLVGRTGNAKHMKESFATETDAIAAAEAEWRRVKRGAATFHLKLAFGLALLGPQLLVRVTGWKAEIDAIVWLSVRVQHLVTPESGFVSSLELETSAVEC